MTPTLSLQKEAKPLTMPPEGIDWVTLDMQVRQGRLTARGRVCTCAVRTHAGNYVAGG